MYACTYVYVYRDRDFGYYFAVQVTCNDAPNDQERRVCHLILFIMLYCTVQYCAILYYTILYFTVVYYTIPYHTML